MADYSFKPRFILPIELGTKQQTIRRYRPRWAAALVVDDRLKGHAKVGGPVGLKTGSRFKPRFIGHAVAQLVDHVRLDFRLDKRWLFGHMGWDTAEKVGDLDRFAVLDGFADWADMREFWREEHDGAVEFAGARIFWGDTFRGGVSAVR